MKFDIDWVDNLFQLKEGDEYNLAFQMSYGVFEQTVMQFGSMNAPADLQRYLNNAIMESLADFASAILGWSFDRK